MLLDFENMKMDDVQKYAEAPALPELRDGDYSVTAVEVKPSLKNPSVLCVWLEVVAGECKGRRFWVFFNVDNPRQVRALYEYATACGLTGKPDASELMGRVVTASIVVKQSNNVQYTSPSVFVNMYKSNPLNIDREIKEMLGGEPANDLPF